MRGGLYGLGPVRVGGFCGRRVSPWQVHYWLFGISRGIKIMYYQLVISTCQGYNLLREESSGAPDL
jgi:hypothetical protein